MSDTATVVIDWHNKTVQVESPMIEIGDIGRRAVETSVASLVAEMAGQHAAKLLKLSNEEIMAKYLNGDVAAPVGRLRHGDSGRLGEQAGGQERFDGGRQ